MRATLVRVGDHFSFAPTDGALVVSGTVTPDGDFAGSLHANPPVREQQHRPNTEAPSFSVSVAGHMDGEVASGAYVTPRCRTIFRLPHIAPSLLP